MSVSVEKAIQKANGWFITFHRWTPTRVALVSRFFRHCIDGTSIVRESLDARSEGWNSIFNDGILWVAAVEKFRVGLDPSKAMVFDERRRPDGTYKRCPAVSYTNRFSRSYLYAKNGTPLDVICCDAAEWEECQAKEPGRGVKPKRQPQKADGPKPRKHGALSGAF